MVSPYLLGVSQGASVGAASAILLGVGTSIAIQGSALAGGLMAVLLTVSIPRLLKNQSTLMLVLSGVIVGGSNSLIGEWMKLSGAKNSLDGVENLKNISLEQIIASQPEYIIIGGADAQKGVDAIKADAAWADVPAVKNGKIIKNPVGTFNWDRYSAEEALQILWAAKLFHPEKFSDVDLVKETREFYSTFYGYQLTEDEAQRIINGQGPATN